MYDLYAVMGNPVTHSKSPLIHSEFAKETHQNLKYKKIAVPINKLTEYIEKFKRNHGKGLNITTPFKQQAYEIVTRLTDRARIARAVNTIKFEDDGEVLGDNTDGHGFIKDLTLNHHIELFNKKILILGAGGTVRGILEPLCKQQPKYILIANRTLNTAVALAADFHPYAPIETTDLDNISGQFDIIINATTSSLQNTQIPLPSSLVTPATFCYDLMYGETTTPFLKWAVANGAKQVADGLGMLIEQAAESFFVWRGVRPNTQRVMALLIKS